MARTRGFTLIELLVVLAIVATLTLLVAPRYFHRIDVAKETTLRENLRITRQVIDRFHGDVGRYPDALQELVDRKYLRTLPMDPITESTSTWKVVAVPEGQQGGVYDIRSGSADASSDGSKYADW